MSWFTTIKIDDRTFAIAEYGHWEKVHSFLLIGEERAALVDTGIGIDDISAVVSGLTNLPIIVITTHCHWDHIGGHRYYSDIAIHSDDREWLEHGIPLKIDEMRALLMQEPFINPPPEKFSLTNWIPFVGIPSLILKDADNIDLGGRQLKILHTPGHSPGHICILDESTGYLLTGDLVYKGTLFAFFESTDPLAYRDSVKRMARLANVKLLLTAHNQPIVEPEFLRHVDECFQAIETKGELCHGTGIHDFGDLRIHL